MFNLRLDDTVFDWYVAVIWFASVERVSNFPSVRCVA